MLLLGTVCCRFVRPLPLQPRRQQKQACSMQHAASFSNLAAPIAAVQQQQREQEPQRRLKPAVSINIVETIELDEQQDDSSDDPMEIESCASSQHSRAASLSSEPGDAAAATLAVPAEQHLTASQRSYSVAAVDTLLQAHAVRASRLNFYALYSNVFLCSGERAAHRLLDGGRRREPDGGPRAPLRPAHAPDAQAHQARHRREYRSFSMIQLLLLRIIRHFVFSQMASLLNGDKFNLPSDATYQIIDCRYPFEYQGGHIRGALNIWHQVCLDKKCLILFGNWCYAIT